MKKQTNKSELTNKAINKSILRKRVAELETRLDNLHILVANIAHNQEMIVKALSPDEEETPFDDINFNEPR